MCIMDAAAAAWRFCWQVGHDGGPVHWGRRQGKASSCWRRSATPNAHATAFDAKLLVTAEAQGGLKVVCEGRLSASQGRCVDAFLHESTWEQQQHAVGQCLHACRDRPFTEKHGHIFPLHKPAGVSLASNCAPALYHAQHGECLHDRSDSVDFGMSTSWSQCLLMSLVCSRCFWSVCTPHEPDAGSYVGCPDAPIL